MAILGVADTSQGIEDSAAFDHEWNSNFLLS